MHVLLKLSIDLLTVIIGMVKPGGIKAVVAENLILKQQLLLLNRSRKRSPNLPNLHRFIFGALGQLIQQSRFSRVSVAFRPSTLIAIHRHFTKRKYRQLFASKPKKKPGPKGPDPEIVRAVVDFKRFNPRCGCRRIAQQLSSTFGIDLDKDEVRRILSAHYKPSLNSHGPSWLNLLGHSKDSLWSMDFFQAESVNLKTHWILVIMDHYSRLIVGFAIQPIAVDGPSLCRMFNQIISGNNLPKRLSFDNAPIFQFKQWKANLRILEIEPIRTVPYVPVSHPFIERLIGTIRREYLDNLFFWNSRDLQNKLNSFQAYYNEQRVHLGINGEFPADKASGRKIPTVSITNFSWNSHCNGHFKMPKAA
jgi:putative transposase